MRKSLVRWSRLAAFVGIIACNGDAVFPVSIEGSYFLEHVGDQALPTLIWTEGSRQYVVEGELIHFYKNGTATWSRSHRLVDNGQVTRSVISGTSSYRIKDGNIDVGSFKPCPDLCAPNQTGVIRDGELILTDRFSNPAGYLFQYRMGIPID